jgi:hypothetical protein
MTYIYSYRIVIFFMEIIKRIILIDIDSKFEIFSIKINEYKI